MNKGFVIYTIGFSIVMFGSAAIMTLQYILRYFSERKWEKSLNYDNLIADEDRIFCCLSSANIPENLYKKTEDMIRQQGFVIKKVLFIWGKEALTIDRGNKHIVKIKRFLPSDRINMALAHELTHIVYDRSDLQVKHCGRSVHSYFPFMKRSPKEQKRDYMAACIAVPRKEFENDLLISNYLGVNSKTRKNLLCEWATKYNVDIPTISRRIKEIELIKRNTVS